MGDSSVAAASDSVETLQRLVDQAASFNLFAVPDRHGSGGAIQGSGGGVGLQASEALHRFDIDLDLPSRERGVRVANVLGERSGRLDLRWMILPHDFRARPDQEPPPTRLDRALSQRFALQEATFRLGDGRDGFRSFGTGRTFPFGAGGRPKLVAAAVGNITEGFGRFSGLEGNYTLCGEITPGNGFIGHIAVRVQDPQGRLLARGELPPIQPEPDPDPETTYLAFAAQKGGGADQVNRFSFAPDGQIRGANISLHTKRVRAGFSAAGPEGFRSIALRMGEDIGKEIGCGRASDPAADPSGSALRPFLFEGTARYSFHDGARGDIGAVTTNVLEGRRFDLRLPQAPEQPAFRFGFFGPVVLGHGCFQGVEGMFYGSSASILNPPPGLHVITHYYVARLHDPDGRFRTGRGR